MQIHGWSEGSKVYLDDKLLGKAEREPFSASTSAGEHVIRVVDKTGESGTIRKRFVSGEYANLAKSDFALSPPKQTPPPNAAEPDDWPQVANSGSTDQLEQYRAQHPNSPHLEELEATLDKLRWEKAMGAGTAAAFDEYLAASRNGRHRDEAQENLAWIKVEASNTIPALHDYLRQYAHGPHSELAGRKMEELRFQEARNSGDEATLRAFLKDYPSGARYDQIFGRLDDLAWEKTNKSDKASLQAYVARVPGGKYVGQANDAIKNLTETAKPPVDAKAEVVKLIERYVKAYNDTNIEELRQIWPGMDKRQVSNMHDFFRMARNVESRCTLLEEPKVNGADATVKIMQVTTFVLKGQQQRQSGTLTLKLKLVSGTAGSWEISSVSED
jgi:hypothetical protein